MNIFRTVFLHFGSSLFHSQHFTYNGLWTKWYARVESGRDHLGFRMKVRRACTFLFPKLKPGVTRHLAPPLGHVIMRAECSCKAVVHKHLGRV
jgi:hypothetical protein